MTARTAVLVCRSPRESDLGAWTHCLDALQDDACLGAAPSGLANKCGDESEPTCRASSRTLAVGNDDK